jgi:cation diffusion facilitator CzcD-associated flavoprotein CzcO
VLSGRRGTTSPVNLHKLTRPTGWFGLAVAKTYIELHPDGHVVVVESASSVGGVWTPERIYPGLKSNNMLGTYEYSDFPMDTKSFGVEPGEHIPGAVVHRYLTAYAQRFGVYERTRLNTRVETAEEDKERSEWTLSVTDTKTGTKSSLKTKKLVIATGLTSQPHMPTFTGQDAFESPLFHIKDFAAHASTLETARHAVVLGGAKSAWDAAYAYAEAGATVDMVIRPSGRGPVWMAPAYVTPLKKWLEKLVHTRLLQWLSPCIWGSEDGYGGIRGFLHSTWAGRKFVDAFWAILGADVVALNKFDSDPALAPLKPWHPAFWVGSGLSILNYPSDFFAHVRAGTIRVHHAEITHLSPRTAHLSTGEKLDADVFVCATGWDSRLPLTLRRADRGDQGADDAALVAKADEAILAAFPRLRAQPDINTPSPSSSPSAVEQQKQPPHLYRFIAPPSTFPFSLSSPPPNLAFAGLCTTISTPLVAQAQALWIVAYFASSLTRGPSSTAQATWVSVLYARFGRWRYPLGYGARVPDFVFDALPYVDMLLRDVGVKVKRKGGWWREVTEPYGPADYRGLVGEWRRTRMRVDGE